MHCVSLFLFSFSSWVKEITSLRYPVHNQTYDWLHMKRMLQNVSTFPSKVNQGGIQDFAFEKENRCVSFGVCAFIKVWGHVMSPHSLLCVCVFCFFFNHLYLFFTYFAFFWFVEIVSVARSRLFRFFTFSTSGMVGIGNNFNWLILDLNKNAKNKFICLHSIRN